MRGKAIVDRGTVTTLIDLKNPTLTLARRKHSVSGPGQAAARVVSTGCQFHGQELR